MTTVLSLSIITVVLFATGALAAEVSSLLPTSVQIKIKFQFLTFSSCFFIVPQVSQTVYMKAEVKTVDYVDVSFVPRTEPERLQTQRDATRLGSTFDKAIFVRYTDATFSTPMSRRREHEVRIRSNSHSLTFSLFPKPSFL
jgi:hypothetical protein